MNASAALEVLRVRGAALVQDGGRHGHMHEGVPPGGALVPELLARANLAAGNAWDAPAIEVFGAVTLASRDGAPRIATERGAIAANQGTWEIARARYVAIAGGFDAPRVLGGCGALPLAGIGAWLRAGDVLRSSLDTGARAGSSAPTCEPLDRADDDLAGDASRDECAIRVVRGPEGERFADSAWHAFLATAFTFSGAADRMGTRLIGDASIARRGDGARDADAPSLPMIRGAIQVPSSNELLVLGPDHPTTGGYPVIAAVIRADLGRFALRGARANATVRFVEVSVELARMAWREHRAIHRMLP